MELAVCLQDELCAAIAGQCALSALGGGPCADRGGCGGECRGQFSLGGRMDDHPLSLSDMRCVEQLRDWPPWAWSASTWGAAWRGRSR